MTLFKVMCKALVMGFSICYMVVAFCASLFEVNMPVFKRKTKSSPKKKMSQQVYCELWLVEKHNSVGWSLQKKKVLLWCYIVL